MNRHFALICLFLIFPLFSFATLLKPWFEQDLLIEFRPEYKYRYYPHVNIKGKNISRHSNDHFVSLSASVAILNTYCAELEIDTATTTHSGYSLEDWKFTGRYLLMNDVEGDPVSLAAGLSISQVTSQGLHDISYTHHGQMEYEAHLSIGKERVCEEFWTSRVWGFASVGIANRGSPWLKIIAGYDVNHWDRYEYGLFLQSLIGFGDHRLSITSPFHGYGSIQYRSIDIGAYMTYYFPDLGDITLEYALRPWAYNFPTHAHTFTIRLMIPYAL